VTTAKSLSGNKLLKDYPSLQEAGMKGFELTIWHGLYAPKGTPPAVLTQINNALKIALKDPDFIKKQEGLGAVVVTDKRVEPAAHKAFVAAETAKLKPLIEAAGKFAD
jgi:tripartite-type tricarboxylate transporter receptor subunit TctC